jgi:ABC-type ATPase with predicted acetyltransferase domain
MSHTLPHLNFLPGEFTISRGRGRDYSRLARFHYLPRRPATWAGVWTIHYHASDNKPQLVAVAVLSYPVPSCLSRRRALKLSGTRNDELKFANRHIRTISRVIVHPQFRALGLSTLLVRFICEQCDTEYVETLAVMRRAIPFFERAGMTRYDPATADGPVYYLYKSTQPSTSNVQC